MNKSDIRILCILTLLAFCPRTASAALLYTADYRIIHTESDAIYNPGASPVSDPQSFTETPSVVVGAFAPYSNSGSVSSAVNEPNGQAMATGDGDVSQTSTMTASFIDAEGEASGSSFSNIPGQNFLGSGSHQSNNLFAVDFTSTTPFVYTLNGTIEAVRSSLNGFASAATGLYSISQSSSVFDFSIDDPPPSIFVHQTVINNQTGVLPAGQYGFTALANSASASINTTTSASAAYDLIFEITPIPEPASVLLFLMGMSGLAMRRGRQLSDT